MLQTNDYLEVKTYFERNCKYGFQHIRAWIISPKFFTDYVNDEVKEPGAVIQVMPLEDYVQEIEGINATIKGYKTIVSDGFTYDYGVCFIADRGISEIADTLLTDNVSKDYNIKKNT